jgi:cytochrome b subunit of formate dehydrogenase
VSLRPRAPRRLAALAGVVGFVAAGLARVAAADDGAKPPAPPPGQACLACHGDAAKAPAHRVDAGALARSVHAKQDCTDCHLDFEAHPHPKDAQTVGCADCHEAEAKRVAASAHGRAPAADAAHPRAAACADCHGVHDVAKSDVPSSRLYPLNVPATCGACHGNGVHVAPRNGRAVADPPVPGKYQDDTHAKALLESGLVVAPTCVTCHGGHDVVASTDPASPVHPARVSETCGACHAGIVATYRESVHGKTPRDASKTSNHREPATCTDCHRPHRIQRVDEDFRLGVIRTCSSCHADRGGTYRGTYHGRITEMGYGGVASCDECHTAHDIRRSSDPASSVHPSRRHQTCAKCHAGATPEFASYQVHADPQDRSAYPVLFWARRLMTGVIVVTWCLAGLHIVLWFQRAIRERRKHHAARTDLTGRWYQRWPPFYRALHMTVACSFLLLALTGLPLRFHDAPWSGTLYSILGGPQSVRFLHRLGGTLTFVYFLAYVVHVGRRLARGEKGLFAGPVTLLPRWKDVQDIRANFRWFLRGGERPKFERWTYWEKFDFWAEVWGVGFIGLTGLIMWFPIQATSVLPGWAINLAHVLHSYEALLATGFIFSVHFFHANLRPGKFPMDPIIFTGRIPEEELRLEHAAEYERMKADGRLEREALPPPDATVVRRAFLVGGVLLSIGLLLLFLMLSTVFW